ncbi:MBOAT family O-acyltransferase [Dongia rigui]|uniref:Probable alginate O-acetylase AlgI n=1 Tax=Dongia rigui TaxID=940149 RepID=A0ABU5E0L4_9PROT|nr:MBOAT family protein [Dongia rigui]MDY0873134.1 MBOAT family protein [Dongia rigui]
MLFNSYQFLFAFLPATLALFFLLGRFASRDFAIGFLALASVFFYAWWNWVYIILILAEVVFSFLVGRQLERTDLDQRKRHLILAAAIALILLVLGYFKYTNFFLGMINEVGGTQLGPWHIILPLGISFHTFQQIAYLVDAYRRSAKHYRLIDFCLFVTFFPQLIAGPIVHHNEAIPQIRRPGFLTPRGINLLVGLSLFGLGLFKKTIIADTLAQVANPAFNAAAGGAHLTLVEAWMGALAYSLQLYFDFSGYSDMAIGLARMFNVRFPANFHSPYKAVNIADFWRRWHMTLSRFLRDYLYIPLGGNRQGTARQVINLFLTMLLGGLWHGAGWTFVIWGAMHGIFLAIQRLWSSFAKGRGFVLPRWLGWLITTLCVMAAWVYFRAPDVATAHSVLASLVGGHGFSLKTPNLPDMPLDGWPVILLAGLVAVLAPNSTEIFRRYAPTLKLVTLAQRRLGRFERYLEWRPVTAWALIAGIVTTAGAVAILGWQSEFLYFQF